MAAAVCPGVTIAAWLRRAGARTFECAPGTLSPTRRWQQLARGRLLYRSPVLSPAEATGLRVAAQPTSTGDHVTEEPVAPSVCHSQAARLSAWNLFANYPHVREIAWVQEEPRNMGAWSYVSPHLASLVDSAIEVEVISRPERSSPATGLSDLYRAEQEQIIVEALRSPVGHKPASAPVKQ